MRFKKLRISVGIALIIFILVVGNIIVLGELIKDKSTIKELPDQNIALVDPKKISPQQISIETKPEQPVKDIQNTVDTAPAEQSNPTVIETVPSPEPVVVHTRRRTRAS